MIEQYITEIVTALIGVVGVIATAVYGYKTKVVERKHAEAELRFQASAMDFSAFMTEWDGVYLDLLSLMHETEVDRFLILRAWNGHLKPKWATAVFQMRQGNQEPISYVHVELDKDYIDRLYNAVNTGSMIMHVDDAEESMIKDVYDAEGVKTSVWYHIETLQNPATDGHAITYCSFATKEKDMDKATLSRCRNIASRLKGVAYRFRADSCEQDCRNYKRRK